VAKISVSMDDQLLSELKEAAGDNVSAFIAGAVRRQLRRQQLAAYLVELEEEMGPPTEEELAEAAAAFEEMEAAIQRNSRKRRSA
jgi:post-segregation antitoxin (ccd killing protein)